MAGTNGQTPDSLIEQLKSTPYAFDFFRAVRLLESSRTDKPRIGHSQSAAEDPIRFCQNPFLIFAPSTIEALRQNAPGDIPKLFLYFFGLFGPHAPLPPHLTEYAYERQHQPPPRSDRSIAGFFDIFHHRLASFFYRAWAANQKSVDLDRPGEGRYPSFIGSFLGIGMESLQDRDAVPDWAKLFFSGRLSSQTRNAEGLAAILEAFFEIKTEIQTFAGRWIDLPPGSTCKLGESEESGSLGLTAILGSRFWECQLSFRAHLGPMKLKDYERLLPSGEAFKRLKCWILNYCGEHFFWDVQMTLEAAEVPQTCLGSYGRVGWTTWLKTQPFQHDADDLILNPPPD
jgi:type VI secretion system protein ImpH